MTVPAGIPRDDAQLAVPPILVVDDSKGQRQLLARTLARWGYATVEAESGEAALALCKATAFDIVISDWMMPGMSGVELCKAFRALSDRPAIFILLTAQTERDALAEGLESGADDFLSKPFHPVELRARLRAGERVLQAQRALARKNAALSEALEELSDTYAAIDRDLRGARTFQEALVPERHLSLRRTDISLLFQSSGHVGGDLVGHFRVSPFEVGVFSVDVSGHGIASALMTARIAGYLSDGAPDRNIALRKVADGYVMVPLEEVCARLNQIVLGDAESDQYLTMSIARVNLSNGEVQLCQAGHPSPALQRRGGAVEFLELWSTPIGLVGQPEFASATIRLDAGDRLILYSDGLTECPGTSGDQLEDAGLARLLREHAQRHGRALTEALMQSLITFRGGPDFPDDLSAVVVERR